MSTWYVDTGTAVYVVNMQCMFILCLFVQSPDRTESLSSSVNEGHSDTLPDDSGSISSSITQPSIADTLTMSGSETTTRGSQVQFAHVLEKDCFMVFRSLCKLSMKSVTDIHDSKLVIFPYIVHKFGPLCVVVRSTKFCLQYCTSSMTIYRLNGKQKSNKCHPPVSLV